MLGRNFALYIRPIRGTVEHFSFLCTVPWSRLFSSSPFSRQGLSKFLSFLIHPPLLLLLALLLSFLLFSARSLFRLFHCGWEFSEKLGPLILLLLLLLLLLPSLFPSFIQPNLFPPTRPPPLFFYPSTYLSLMSGVGVRALFLSVCLSRFFSALPFLFFCFFIRFRGEGWRGRGWGSGQCYLLWGFLLEAPCQRWGDWCDGLCVEYC